MFEEKIYKYYSNSPFDNKKLPVISLECRDGGCKLNGNFDDSFILNGDNIVACLKSSKKSVDFILFAKKLSNDKIDVLLCELCDGKKRYEDVLEKTRSSGEYILNVFEQLGYSVRNFDCIYLGRYRNESRLPLSQAFTIPGFWRNDLKIRRFECGQEISEIENLSFHT